MAKVAEFFQVGVGPDLGQGGRVGAGSLCWGQSWEGARLSQHTFSLQGVDVIVNASSVEDIDAGAIGQRLSNGLARLSSPVLHRLRLREDENTEPVVSVPGTGWPGQGFTLCEWELPECSGGSPPQPPPCPRSCQPV